MMRFVSFFWLLTLLICSIGCRMCGSPYDYCISAYIDRCDDFRGCGPLYRAGSILGNGNCNTCQTGGGSFIDDGEINAGNYGVITPISESRDSSDGFDYQSVQRQESERLPVAKPQQTPENNGWINTPPQNSEDSLPSIEELLKRSNQGTAPHPTPIIPPAKPKQEPPLIETLPFSPSDEEIKPIQPAVPAEPTITLEELRRLDPTVSDIQIISIKDAAEPFVK